MVDGGLACCNRDEPGSVETDGVIAKPLGEFPMPKMTCNSLVAACAAVTFSLLGATASNASALIDSHTGTVGSSPGGTGAVDVSLSCVEQSQEENCVKTFRENETHQINWVNRLGGSSRLVETIVNASGTPWTDFHWEWEGFDFVSIIVDVGCDAGAGTQCVTDAKGLTSFDLFFKEPFTPVNLPPVNGTDTLTITFGFEGDGTLIQYPTFDDIPEPGTLALFGLGLVGLGLARRRRKRTI